MTLWGISPSIFSIQYSALVANGLPLSSLAATVNTGASFYQENGPATHALVRQSRALPPITIDSVTLEKALAIAVNNDDLFGTALEEPVPGLSPLVAAAQRLERTEVLDAELFLRLHEGPESLPEKLRLALLIRAALPTDDLFLDDSHLAATAVVDSALTFLGKCSGSSFFHFMATKHVLFVVPTLGWFFRRENALINVLQKHSHLLRPDEEDQLKTIEEENRRTYETAHAMLRGRP